MTLVLEQEASDRLAIATDASIRKVARFDTHHFTHNPSSFINRTLWTFIMHPYHFYIEHCIEFLAKILQKSIYIVFLIGDKFRSSSPLLVVWGASTTSWTRCILGDKCCKPLTPLRGNFVLKRKYNHLPFSTFILFTFFFLFLLP